MTLSRREFGKAVGVGSLVLTTAGSSLFLGGCNFAQDIVNFEPTAANALTSIENILGANGIIFSPVVQEAFTAAQAALVAMKAAAEEYLAINPPPATTTAKLRAALQAVVDQVGAFLKALALPNGGILSLVLALAQLILSTIAGFMGNLPTSLQMKLAHVELNGVPVTITPVKRTRRAFKKQWNSELDGAKKFGVGIPKKAYLPMNMFERM